MVAALQAVRELSGCLLGLDFAAKDFDLRTSEPEALRNI